MISIYNIIKKIKSSLKDNLDIEPTISYLLFKFLKARFIISFSYLVFLENSNIIFKYIKINLILNLDILNILLVILIEFFK